MLDYGFDRLKIRLVRDGLPVRHAARIAGELKSHAEDIEEELAEAVDSPGELRARVLERLGDLDFLAAHIRERFARRTFWGRHPVTTFVILPVLSFSLLVLVPVLLGKLLTLYLDVATAHGVGFRLDAIIFACRTAFDAYQVVFAAGSAFLFICALRGRVCSLKWPAVATAIMAVIQYFLMSTMTLGPAVEPGRYLTGAFTLGLGLADPFDVERIARFCVPVALFLLAYGGNIWHGYIRGRGTSPVA